MARMYVNRTKRTYEGVDVLQTEEDGTTVLTWFTDVSNKFANNGRVMLMVKTGAVSGTPVIDKKMTVISRAKRLGLDLEDRVIELTANKTQVFGPFPSAAHNELRGDDKGYTTVEFNDDTGLEVTAFALP